MNADASRAENKMKNLLADGKSCIGATLTIGSPEIAELYSRIGFDWIWIEMEHTTTSELDALRMLQTTNGADISAVVRVPWNDKTMIKRALDTGPDAIIVPLVNSKEEAEHAVKAMKYPPTGERGAGLGRAQGYGLQMAEYYQTANDTVMTILMIEHIDAVNNIEEILSVPGVDTIMIGALDLSGSMGMLGNTADPKVEEAIQKVLKACKDKNIPAGIIAVGVDNANARIEQGFQNIIVGIDILYLLGGAKADLDKINRG